MTPKKAFVTGGTGLVGSHLLVELAKQGTHITALKRDSADTKTVQNIFKFYGVENLYRNITWVPGDILDIISLEEHIANQDVVYHTAAMVSFNPKDEKALFEINVEGTSNVVNACLNHGVAKLVYVSSTAAVGKGTGKKPVVESNEWDEEGISNYALSKHYAENEVWRGNAEGLNIIIVNPCVIIGPGNWNKSSTTIFKTISNGLRFYTKGANAFVDVKDVVRAMLMLEEKEVYNDRFLLIGENLTYKELFTKVALALGVKPPSILVKGFWTQLFWRVEWLRSLLTGSAPIVTKESANSAISTVAFSADKIKDQIGFEFVSIDDAAKNAARYFLLGK